MKEKKDNNMNETSLNNIKQVLKEFSEENNLNYDFLTSLLETELLDNLDEKDKIKAITNLINMEVK
jgi:3-dehydroquinate dehydratase